VIASLVLLAAAGWLLLVPPTIAEPGLCHMADGDLVALGAWSEADARNATLRTQLAALVDNAGRRRLRCSPVAQVVAPPRPDDSTRAQMRGGHRGKLQIILAWDDRNDLDLHIRCPDNEELFFGNRQACGGEQDIDANAKEILATAMPVETIFWSDPPPGTYKIIVDPFDMREGSSSAFRVTVRREGRPDQVREGMATAGQRLAPVLEVQVSAP
jgi:hypothetical protein